MASSKSNTASQNGIILGDNKIVCSLINKVIKTTEYRSLKRQQMELYEREIMCRHKTVITMFGESRYIIFSI